MTAWLADLHWKWPVVLLALAYRLLFGVAGGLALLGWLVFGWRFGAGAAAGFVMTFLAWLADRLRRESGINPFDLRARWLDDHLRPEPASSYNERAAVNVAAMNIREYLAITAHEDYDGETASALLNRAWLELDEALAYAETEATR